MVNYPLWNRLAVEPLKFFVLIILSLQVFFSSQQTGTRTLGL